MAHNKAQRALISQRMKEYHAMKRQQAANESKHEITNEPAKGIFIQIGTRTYTFDEVQALVAAWMFHNKDSSSA